MELYFSGGGEVATLIIDRVNKLLQISSTKTGNEIISAEWKNLFDKGKEEEQDKKADKLNDKDFARIIILTMQTHGYELDKLKW